MVEATVVLKDGTKETVKVGNFWELFERFDGKGVVAISGKLIRSKDVQQVRCGG